MSTKLSFIYPKLEYFTILDKNICNWSVWDKLLACIYHWEITGILTCLGGWCVGRVVAVCLALPGKWATESSTMYEIIDNRNMTNWLYEISIDDSKYENGKLASNWHIKDTTAFEND